VAQAQAVYDKLVAGATAEQIAAADAQLRVTQAQLRQTTGSVTKADHAAAAAQLQQAQEHLAELRAGPKPVDLRSAQVQLEQAQTNLAAQRDGLSAAKTNAQLQMQQRVNDLTEAQAAYATAKRNWLYAQETGRDPNAVLDPNTGKKTRMKLDDKQKQQYYDAYVQAEAAMHGAEVAVTQAQVAYDAARQAEVSGIQAAEQQVAQAQTDLDRLRAGADADELAAARAQVASSQASIDKLGGEQRGGTLEAAQASVDQAQAELDRLRAGAAKSDLAVAAAEVQSANAGLKLAEVALTEAELRAPFGGTIAALGLKVGEYIAAGTPVVHLADLSAWQIETTDLTELSVVSVHEGSPAAVTFDAIPGLELLGKVSRIRALGENKQGDITYIVTIAPDRQETRLRWNMTASVEIAP
jgi:HlyD family secretion protein